MSADREGIDFKKYKKNCDIFIETGSEYGHGIQAAINAGFKEFYSVELDQNLHNHCKERFADNPNVILRHGSSTYELPKILDSIQNENIFLWLDAHWCGGAGENMFTFLPKELNSILPFKKKLEKAVILIDDMNFFINDKNFINTVENLLSQIKPGSKIEYFTSHTGATLLACYDE